MGRLTAIFLMLFTSTLTCFGENSSNTDDPQVVEHVDFQRYSGLWYEVAHNRNFFQRHCLRSTADYKVLSDTQVSVLNTCYKKGEKISDIDGVATVKDPSVPAKLRVKFNFFQRGDYWIVDLDPQYQWAVVSGPRKKSLFILTRTAPMDEALEKRILGDLKARGFNVDDLVFDQY